MGNSYLMEISVALPVSEAQFDGVLQLLDAMDGGETALLIRVSNHRDFEDFMAAYLERRGGGYRMELDYPMESFGWKYPLVLAGSLSAKETGKLLRELLVDVTGSGESDAVNSRFRRVKAVRYGEKEAKKYSRE